MMGMRERWMRRGQRALPLLCLLALSGAEMRGQGVERRATVGGAGMQGEAPGAVERQSSLQGVVADPSGALIAGARVTVAGPGGATVETGADGAFRFAGLAAGTVQITVARTGFSDQTIGVDLAEGQSFVMPPVVLQIAAAKTEVNVVYSQQAVAEEQIRAQEKQRILGVLPNFGVSYVWHAAPLTPGQKFRLAFRSEIDPVSFLGAAVGAGYEQANNYRAGYGQGAQGFAKRFGATYTDGFDGAMLGGFILPSLLHQDPRYFYMGKEHGTVRHRALYAISTVVICRGDNGKWQPNYSNMLGNLSAGAISNLYYPASDRGAALTVQNALLGTAAGAIGSLVQEFVNKHISTGVPKK